MGSMRLLLLARVCSYQTPPKESSSEEETASLSTMNDLFVFEMNLSRPVGDTQSSRTANDLLVSSESFLTG